MTKQVSSGGNITYYINEDSGVVVAKIIMESYEPFEIVESIVSRIIRADQHNAPYEIFACGGFRSIKLPKYCTGIARCSPKDTFDVETGKKIALARAQQKYHALLSKSLDRISDHFCRIVMAINGRMNFELEQAEKYAAIICDEVSGAV